jgi:excisionase family DNA binding protein
MTKPARAVGFGLVWGGLKMARLVAIERGPHETDADRSTQESPSLLEVLLTSKEASQILKIHPKVLERMAKRGEVPALKVGKFWRYRATTLDAWINSRLQSGGQVCRIATSF